MAKSGECVDKQSQSIGANKLKNLKKMPNQHETELHEIKISFVQIFRNFSKAISTSHSFTQKNQFQMSLSFFSASF